LGLPSGNRIDNLSCPIFTLLRYQLFSFFQSDGKMICCAALLEAALLEAALLEAQAVMPQ
jgi:hypothetical protein